MTTAVEESIAHLDFDPDLPRCTCLRQNATRPCDDPAVTWARLEFIPHGCIPHGCGPAGITAVWYYLCAAHREHARNGTLKCGYCKHPGAWVILEERPL